MQEELNAAFGEADEDGSADFLLLRLLHRLRLLLDVYVETEGISGASRVRGALCNRVVRGRDRRKPFTFDEASRCFDQSA